MGTTVRICRLFIILISIELYEQQQGYVVYLLSVLVMNYDQYLSSLLQKSLKLNCVENQNCKLSNIGQKYKDVLAETGFLTLSQLK